MSSLIPPTQRPSVPGSLGNHEALERSRPGGWLFNFDNEGGWGYVQFNDCFDLDLLPDPLEQGGDWGAALEDASGCGLLLGSDGGLVLIKARGSGITLQASTNLVLIAGGAASQSIFTAGETYTINDHLGSPLVTYTG